MIYLIIGLILIIICIIFTIYMIKHKNMKEIDYKVILSSEELIKELDKKLDIIARLINILERNTKKDNKIFKKVKNITSDRLNNFEKDTLLTEASDLILDMSENKDFKKVKSFDGLIEELKECNLKIIALRTYYNKYAAIYNNYTTKFINKIFLRVKKYQTKKFFEGKELEEENL